MRLRTRYALVLLGIFLVLGTVVVGSAQLFQQQTENREQRDVTETARLAAGQVDEALERQRDRLVSRSSIPPANLSAASGSYLRSTIEDSAFDAALFVDDDGIIRDIRGIDENSPLSREAIIGTNDSDERYFQRSFEQGAHIAEPTVESDGRVTIVMGARIVQNGTRAGVLAAVITAYDPLAEAETHNLFSSLSALNTGEQNARVIQRQDDEEIVMAGAGTGFDESLTSRALSEASGWIVEIERDRSTLLDQLQALQYIQFGSLLVVLVSVAGLGFYEYRTNLKQTDRLLDGFDELTEGNFGHTLDLTAAKEWEQIGSGFNTMADGLRERETELKEREREIREREQRLSVLNRVLRHNLQNDMTVIQGYAEVIPHADSAKRREEAAAKIIEKSRGLVDHGKKARRLEEVMENASDGTAPIDIAARTADIVDSYEQEYPAATVHTSLPETAYASAVAGVEFGIESLVENAFEHNDSDDPEVWITVESGGEEVTVEVRDNGPGIPEHERKVLTQDEESSLEHGSGIGLWLAYWAVTKSGGELTFGDGDGGVVRVRLPAADEPPETPEFEL